MHPNHKIYATKENYKWVEMKKKTKRRTVALVARTVHVSILS